MNRCNVQSCCINYAKLAFEKFSHGKRQVQFFSTTLSQTRRNERYRDPLRAFSNYVNCSNNFSKNGLHFKKINKNYYGMLTRNLTTFYNAPSTCFNQTFNYSNYINMENHVYSLSQFSTTASTPRKKTNDNKPLLNDKLVQQLELLQKRKGEQLIDSDSSSNDIEVRVVMDIPQDSDKEENNNNKSKTPPNVSVLPLSIAIESAKQLNLDLMEINLNQTPPIIRVTDYSKLVYEQNKKKRSLKEKGNGNNKLPTKEYKFSAGISEHDLERKVKKMESYLQKGHSCKVTITAKNVIAKQNTNATMETLDRVQSFISDYIIEDANIRQGNERHLSVTYQPKR